jgi:hypothetical protein
MTFPDEWRANRLFDTDDADVSAHVAHRPWHADNGCTELE